MGRQITSPLHVARHVLMTDKAWLLFVEIPTSGGGAFRMVRDGAHRTANGVTWVAASIEIELPGEDAESGLGQLVIAVPNVSRIPMAYLELDNEDGSQELLGREVTCWLQHETRLAEFEAALSWRQRAVVGTADNLRLRLECTHPTSAERIPKRVFGRAQFPQLSPVGVYV